VRLHLSSLELPNNGRPLRQMRLKAQQFKPLLGGFFVGVYFACRVSGVLGIALAIGSTDSTENLA
jgi:hypothetical protein